MGHWADDSWSASSPGQPSAKGGKGAVHWVEDSWNATSLGQPSANAQTPLLAKRRIPFIARNQGKLIGKGGEEINRIRRESGATIEVRHPEGEDNAYVEITGFQEELDRAEMLINNRLEEFTSSE